MFFYNRIREKQFFTLPVVNDNEIVRSTSNGVEGKSGLRQDPPLDLSFWSFLTFLHHSIDEVERHLLRKF